MEKLNNSLDKKTIKSGRWVIASRIIQQLFYLTRTIVLARLLSPNDFGLFGIALLALTMLDTFSRTGFRQAIIQKKDNTTSYLDTVWTIGLIRGVIIASILFLIAPYVAVFFNTEKAVAILRVIGLAMVFRSLTNIAVVYFEKELKFHKYFVYEITGSVTDLAVSVSAALIFRSVWALVLGRLAGNFMRCITSYIIDPYRPQFSLNMSKAKELFGFGKWVLGSSILVFLITQGDDIVVGKIIGATALGFYQMAYLLSNLPATEITYVISQVTFPAYSIVQDNIPRLREAYLRVLKVAAFFSFLLAALLFVLAQDLTKIFLGTKWLPMVPAMKVLVICGVIRAIGSTTGPVFQAVGKPRIITKLTMVKLAVLVVLIFPLTRKFGILGTSFALLGASLVTNPLADYKVIKLTGCALTRFAKLIFTPLIAAVIMYYLLEMFRIYLPIQNIMCLIVYIFLGFIIYMTVLVLSEKLIGYRIKEELIEIARNITK